MPRNGFSKAPSLLPGNGCDIVKPDHAVRNHGCRRGHGAPFVITHPAAEFPRGRRIVENLPKPCRWNVEAQGADGPEIAHRASVFRAADIERKRGPGAEREARGVA